MGTLVISTIFLVGGLAGADPRPDPVAIAPDPPSRPQQQLAFARPLAPAWDLDGLYLWLGPTGAAGFMTSSWDSVIGGDATVVRIREHETLGAIGGSLGAARWTARDGGRVWLDAIAGTPAFGRMFGVSAGPVVELADLRHPKLGGSIGVWGFIGVTPYARVGVVAELGAFAEVGVHIALPVIRRRPH